MWMLILEGLAIGTLLGLTGAGGGILAVPALMASQGWTVAQAFIATLQPFVDTVIVGSATALVIIVSGEYLNSSGLAVS